MIEFLPQSEGNAVGIKVSGTLTHEDYQEMIPKLESLLKQHDKINMLVQLGDPAFDHMELRALWDDARFGLPHRNDFEKFAIVGDLPKWMGWGTKVGAWFTSAEIKEFDKDNASDAWQWVKPEKSLPQ